MSIELDSGLRVRLFHVEVQSFPGWVAVHASPPSSHFPIHTQLPPAQMGFIG